MVVSLHLLELLLLQWNDASYNDSIGGRSWKERYWPVDLLSTGITVYMYVLGLGWEESVSEINCREIYWLFPTFPPLLSASVLTLHYFLLLRDCATAFPEILGVVRIQKKLQLTPVFCLLSGILTHLSNLVISRSHFGFIIQLWSLIYLEI